MKTQHYLGEEIYLPSCEGWGWETLPRVLELNTGICFVEGGCSPPDGELLGALFPASDLQNTLAASLAHSSGTNGNNFNSLLHRRHRVGVERWSCPGSRARRSETGGWRGGTIRSYFPPSPPCGSISPKIFTPILPRSLGGGQMGWAGENPLPVNCGSSSRLQSQPVV